MQCGRCAGCCSVPFLPRKCHYQCQYQCQCHLRERRFNSVAQTLTVKTSRPNKTSPSLSPTPSRHSSTTSPIWLIPKATRTLSNFPTWHQRTVPSPPWCEQSYAGANRTSCCMELPSPSPLMSSRPTRTFHPGPVPQERAALPGLYAHQRQCRREHDLRVPAEPRAPHRLVCVCSSRPQASTWSSDFGCKGISMQWPHLLVTSAASIAPPSKRTG